MPNEEITSYSLITEPWIPVLYMNGTVKEIGLREALMNAHQIRAVQDALLLSELGIYRLLLAFVLDIFLIEPRDDRPINHNMNGLRKLLQGGWFNAAAIDAYFAEHGKRFDLFSEEYPFLQTPGFEDGGEKPLAGLLPPQPSGTFVAHFQHGHENDFAVSPAVAARLLTTIAPFMTAGGAGLSPSVNGAPPWYIWINGKSLFEMLCRNLYLGPAFKSANYEEPPAWRLKSDCVPGMRRVEALYAQALTWQPRRIRLVAGSSGVCALTGVKSPVLVRTMYFKPGDSCEGKIWDDPNVAYYVSDEKLKPLPQRAKEDREVWRDTGPLALLEQRSGNGKDRRFIRPLVVTQFAELADREPSQEEVGLTLYGVRTDGKMKVFEWQKESLQIPVGVMRNPALVEEAQGEMQNVDLVAYALRDAIKKSYERDGAGNKAAFDTRVNSASRTLFQALRHPYKDLLDDLATTDSDEPQLEEREVITKRFRGQIWRETWRAFDSVVRDLAGDEAALVREMKARNFLNTKLNMILFPKPPLPKNESELGATSVS